MESKKDLICNTSDFQTAVVLRMFRFKLLELKINKKRKVTFVFDAVQEDGNKTDEVMSDYWNYKLSVDARSMAETQEELKTRMFDTLKG